MAIDIQELSLKEVMGERFARYSKYIIQDRALPDIRDGLKPVQRRILYAMYRDGNTHQHSFRKSAKTIGNVIGNYHPHGDTSVYEAMVRMSQSWKNRETLIEMHGNNGSIDADPPAAMRYTEARLSKIADELLKDIDKNTINTVLNFDDTEEEPTVLPSAFPNLLVNGATGISAGYATNIPPHNLREVILALLHLIDQPDATLQELMAYLPGPDFPTGGIIQGKTELRKAYENGQGKVVVRAKCQIRQTKRQNQEILISEIPYEVNKAELVRKLDEIRLTQKVDGLIEVRDESDRNGLCIVLELKKNANAQAILNYCYKHTNLQVNYNFNMVAITHERPKQLGLKAILQAYITHRKEVIKRRTQFNLTKAQERAHILEGLIRAISILDEIIRIIRASKNKRDAKNNLISSFEFTEVQSEAIVSLQLYRLTNTDILDLEIEKASLNKNIQFYQKLLTNEDILFNEMKKELSLVSQQYGSNRLTKIEAEVDEIEIDQTELIHEEEVIVLITKEAYIKRTSLRSYKSSNIQDIGLRDGDQIIYLSRQSTLDNLLLITSKGNYIYQPVHELQDIRWKDLGEHLSQRITLENNENIVYVTSASQSTEDTILLATKEGMIKQTPLKELKAFRGHKSRSTVAIPLANERDSVVYASRIESGKLDKTEVILFSHLGFALRYYLSEVTTVGLRAKGVKSINLKQGDFVVAAVSRYLPKSDDQLILITQRGHAKRLRWSDINQLGRAKRGLVTLKEIKSKPHYLVAVNSVNSTQDAYRLYFSDNTIADIKTGEVPILDRYSNGRYVGKETKASELVSFEAISTENMIENILNLEEV